MGAQREKKIQYHPRNDYEEDEDVYGVDMDVKMDDKLEHVL